MGPTRDRDRPRGLVGIRTIKVPSLEDGVSPHRQEAEDSGSVCLYGVCVCVCVVLLGIRPESVLVPKLSW